MPRTAAHLPSPPRLVVLVAVVAVLAQALLVPLFAAPAANLEPRDLPIVVAGPAPVADEFAARLAAGRPGAFAVTTVPDEAAANRALWDRSAYAAFITGPDGLTVHTATAASPTVAGLLSQTVPDLGRGTPVRIVDVVPADPDDPRGAGFGAGFLPLALISMLVGVLLFLLGAGRVARLTGLVTFGVVAGLAGATVLHSWLGILPGNFWAEAAAIGLVALAVAATVTGLGVLFGRPGVGLGVLLVFLVGNPLSGVTSAPELLPQPWGEVGQWLPVGAGGTLLRSVAFFEGAGSRTSLGILCGYALLGMVLVLIGRSGRPIRSHPDAGPGALATDGAGTSGQVGVTTG